MPQDNSHSPDLWVPGPEHVIEAASRISPAIHRTPVLRSSTIDRMAGRAVYMKAEHLQKTGSYKARGATNQIRYLLERRLLDDSGVVAASSGNHGQAVAWAAQEAKVKATIVVPSSIASSKLQAIEGYGARVVVVESDSEERLRVAAELSEKSGLRNIPPYDHPLTIAGQGTCVCEALEQVEVEVEAVAVPVSGGGLAAGTALAIEAKQSKAALFAVEPEGADDTRRSFRAGRRVDVEPHTIADALRVRHPGELTFRINQARLRDVVLVSDPEISKAMRLVWERMKQVVEPAGAVALAAVLEGRIPGYGPVLVVLSGGNADLDSIPAPWWGKLQYPLAPGSI